MAGMTWEGAVSVDEVPDSADLSDMVDVKIIEIIRKDPHATAKQMSESIGLSVRTIRRHISSLTDGGYISREGTTRGGKFYISYDVVNKVLDDERCHQYVTNMSPICHQYPTLSVM